MIIVLNMATEISQGVSPLLNVRTDPIPEDNNSKFSRGSPTELSLTLGPTQLYGSTNNLILLLFFGVTGLPLDEGG